jgi:hypothetical protein
LILKDLRAYFPLHDTYKNKKINDLFALSLLAERASRELAARAAVGNQREEKKAAAELPQSRNLQGKDYQNG